MNVLTFPRGGWCQHKKNNEGRGLRRRILKRITKDSTLRRETAEGPAVVHKTARGMPLTYRGGAKKDLSHITAGLRSVLDLDRRGGRLFQRDNETIILIDCNRFTSEQIDCLQTVYPQLQATVVQSDASVTGFLIIFQMTSPTFKRAAALLAVHVILFACGLSGLWVSYSKTSTV
jgi:hypothetical protein